MKRQFWVRMVDLPPTRIFHADSRLESPDFSLELGSGSVERMIDPAMIG